jgi:Tfp pilus assembly protein PilO
MMVRSIKGVVMALSLRNMVAILVTIVILLGVFFVATLYYPTNKRAKRIANSRAILEAQVEAASPAGGQAKRETEIIEKMGGDVNYFKRRNLSPARGIPELLEQINRMGNQAKIQFVVVKPLDEKEAPGYRQYSIFIEAESPYSELVSFVYRLENDLHLSLKDLRIESDEQDRPIHRLHFTLNIFELKDDTPTGRGESDGKQVFRPVDMDLVAVQRDPFSPKEGAQVVQLPTKPKGTKVASEKPRRPKLVLTGIADIGQGRFVIINDEILKVGDTIQGQRIEQIEDGYVTILNEDTTYPLYLDGSRPFELLESKP